MNRRFSLIMITLVLSAFAFAVLSASGAQATCTATGFWKDGRNLTAAVINPTGTYSSTLEATGCDIGVYYGPGATGSVDGASISNANYFGILVTGDTGQACGASAPTGSVCATGATSVDVTNSIVSDINDHPLDGDQHGTAVAYEALAVGASATGTVSGTTISDYQKSGIVALGPGATIAIRDNTVEGVGPTPLIAQNGIEIDYGASGQAMRNTVTGNSYTGDTPSASAGILVFGGCGFPLVTGVQIVKNVVGDATPSDGNDMGIALVNLNSGCSSAPSAASNVKVINNTIVNTQESNADGSGGSVPYQAGIADCGNNDKLINNDISGDGYDPDSGSGYHSIDTDDCTTAAKVHANSTP